MTKNIIIKELNEELPQMGLKKGDFYTAYPMDFYSGAGVYGMQTANGIIKLHYCIETLDGKIQASEVGTASSRLMSQNDFRKTVKTKVFARVVIDNNLPAIAVSELKETLLGE